MQKVTKCDVKLVDGIAVVYLNNPPVNALSMAIRNDIYDILTAALIDDSILAVVLTTRDLPFSAGADIKEFAGPMQGKFFLDFYQAIQDLNKPVITGIRQYALGGGLEFCMLGHYRVASKGARLGLPEVKLGLIPGGTGTMSLPRLVGVEKALEMILTSQSISAEEALEIGLVDRVATDDLEQCCIDFARQKLEEKTPLQLPLHLENPQEPSKNYFAEKRKELEAHYRGFKAPIRLLNCLEACTQLPVDQGLQFEMKQFTDLITGEDSAGMRYAFFSERLSSHVPGVRKEDVVDISQVGVIGGGLMGSGIAMAFLNRGFTVLCLEVDQSRADHCFLSVKKQYEKSVSMGKISEEDGKERLSRFQVTTEIKDFSRCDLVIEAVFEKLELKCDIMQRLDKVCAKQTILASNTSGLDLNKIAASTNRPEQVIGLHFFSPAHVMRLLEVVRTKQTNAQTLATGLHVAKKLKKVAVVVGVCPGFVGNRMIFKYFEQVVWLLLRGCTPRCIDQAMKDFGFPMGPCEMADMSGLDIWVHANPDDKSLVHHFVKSGRLGQKSASGFYDYKEGSKKPQDSDEVHGLIAEYAKSQQISQQDIDDDMIVKRLLCALINEGMHILTEKVAMRSSDIDTIYVHGYGFPIYRGGPMFYADKVGLETIQSQLQALHKEDPSSWIISDLLAELIAENKKLSAYQVR